MYSYNSCDDMKHTARRHYCHVHVVDIVPRMLSEAPSVVSVVNRNTQQRETNVTNICCDAEEATSINTIQFTKDTRVATGSREMCSTRLLAR